MDHLANSKMSLKRCGTDVVAEEERRGQVSVDVEVHQVGGGALKRMERLKSQIPVQPSIFDSCCSLISPGIPASACKSCEVGAFLGMLRVTSFVPVQVS